MARLQILELPEGANDDRPPFALVIDQCQGVALELVETIESHWKRVGEEIGAQGVLIFMETVDIPANDTSAYLDAARGGLPADAHYEMTIGGKPVEWTRADELRARAVDAVQERTDIASDADRLARWRIALAEALGMDRLRDWDDIRNAAAGIRKERDARTAIVQWVRDFPAVPETADHASGPSREYLAGYQDAVDAIRRGTFASTAADA